VGTVGVGVIRILTEFQDVYAERCGRAVIVSAISARSKSRDRGLDLAAYRWESDPIALASAPDVDVVVEVMGGAGDPAYSLVKRALELGKPVVTANKALLSKHGLELAALAEKTGAQLNFEAAVAGGIPIIKAIRESLVGNKITRLYGILNGTCNYILTEMTREGGSDCVGANQRSFAEVLKDAQAKGYAEADPTFDIGGIDAAQKLSLLAGLAFGTQVNFDGVHVEGIEAITNEDIAYADELGYRIKLLGIARQTQHGIEQRVHPALVPKGSPIARIDGVTNAVMLEGDRVGALAFEGPGAGAGATASAVAADIADIARGARGLPFIVPVAKLKASKPSPMARHKGMYYVRLRVMDRAGVLAAITAILANHDVSIESFIQRGRAPGEAVSVVLTTHECAEETMQAALKEIDALHTVMGKSNFIRIEAL
ncbi:MAG: homoserine dehydrogenase, partial [Alphaproteobacteria bacterium]